MAHERIVYEHPHTFINALRLRPGPSQELAMVGHRLIGLIWPLGEARTDAFEDRGRFAFDCDYDPRGQRLAVAHHGGLVEVYETSTGARLHEVRILRGPPFGARRVAFAPDGDRLVIAGTDGQIVVWSLSRQEIVWRHLNTAGAYGDMCLHDGVILGAQYDDDHGDHSITLHELETGVMRRMAIESTPWTASFSADGERFAVGGERGVLEIFTTSDLRRLQRYEGLGPINHVRPHKDGWHALTGDRVVALSEEEPPRVMFECPGDSLMASALDEVLGVGYVAGRESKVWAFELS